MAAEPRPLSGLAALLIAMAVGIFLALTQRSNGPSRAELAQALSQDGNVPVATSDLRSLKCAEANAQGYACRWEQQIGDGWRPKSGVVIPGAQGWRMR